MELLGLIGRTYQQWTSDNAMRLSASLAMYSMLSLSPLLVITIKVVSMVLAQDVANRQITLQVQALLGPQGAAAVRDMIVETSQGETGRVATLISSVILLFTASGVFAELQDALNTIWRVKSVPALNWGAWFRNRLISMAMVLVVGFLLLVSQVFTTALTIVSEALAGGPGWISFALETTVSVLLITLLFATIYRMLPDVKIDWLDTMLGAAITALLFKAGQYVLALYFTYVATSSAYGAAGSFVALLLWVYYSCWIIFFGAEFTKVYAQHRGRWIAPEEYAEKEDPTDPRGNAAEPPPTES